MNFAAGVQYGLLAQDVINILPQFVKALSQPEVKDSSGNVLHQQVDYFGVTYQPLITLLLAGFKEQQQQINNLQAQITNCCGAPRPLAPSQGNGEKTGAINIKLSNENEYVLYQNVPNPYSTSTTIRFFIPENTTDVKIAFMDVTGKVIKDVPILETGDGSINADGSALIGGTYTYSLVINNKVVETRKMVKVK